MASRPLESGGLSNVATVLIELYEERSVAEAGLVEAARLYPSASVRRAGYLLERFVSVRLDALHGFTRPEVHEPARSHRSALEPPTEHRDRARPVIPSRLITAWSRFAPWLTDEQVEQDLVLSRLIIEIANHPLLGARFLVHGCSLAFVGVGRYRQIRAGDAIRVRRRPFGGDSCAHLRVRYEAVEQHARRAVANREAAVELDGRWRAGRIGDHIDAFDAECVE